MSRAFEHLDSRMTRTGEISLRRRLEPTLGIDVWEVKLGDEFLMASLLTAGRRRSPNSAWQRSTANACGSSSAASATPRTGPARRAHRLGPHD